MGAYIIRRILYVFITIFFVSMLTFGLLYTAGDPAVFLTPVRPGQTPTEEMIEKTRKRFSLDQPIPIQFLTYVKNLLSGDMGDSFYFHRPVSEMMAEVFPKTAILASLIMVVSILIGIPLGILTALKKNSWFDKLVLIVATFLVAIPEFLVAFAFLYVFAYLLGLFPLKGVETWQGWVLPVVSMALPLSFYYAIFLRTNMLNAIGEDYSRTARAKGLPYLRVAMKHVLPNAMIPVVAIAGMRFAGLLTGVIIIETVFGIPGIGLTITRATQFRDIPIIMASVFLTSIFVGMFNMIADLVIARLDPRIRLQG